MNITELSPAERDRFDAMRDGRLPAGVGYSAPAVDLDVPGEPPNLPAGFWEARPELAQIRQAAHARTRSADAVLGVVLARLAVLIPPEVTLPPIVGATGSLDLAVALIGPSGSGKSSSARVSKELVPILDDNVAVVPLGSGEGIVESYLGYVMRPDEDGKPQRVKEQVRRGVLAMLDEGQALAEMGGRRGSTLLPTIRTAWSGDRLGQANASQETRRLLDAGCYRFALVAGFQTDHAVTLLGDAAGGTPQRFAFFAATDPDLPDRPPPWPGPLTIDHTYVHGPLDVDATIADEIRAQSLAVARGVIAVAPLDAHRHLLRLKLAALLGVLDSHRGIDLEDWQLAGQILDASDKVRKSIQATAAAKAHEDESRSIAKADRRATVLTDSEAERACRGMARAIARHVHRGACVDGCKLRCVSRSTAGQHRKLATIDDALDLAIRHGWIILSGEDILSGEAKP